MAKERLPNLKETAELLGITCATLHKWMLKAGISLKGKGGTFNKSEIALLKRQAIRVKV